MCSDEKDMNYDEKYINYYDEYMDFYKKYIKCDCCCVEESKVVNPSDVNTIPKFIDKLPIPIVAKPVCVKKCIGEYYDITMKEVEHSFSSLFPKTKVWGYDGMYPGPTIEAFKDISTFVRWNNQLPSKHILPFDKTLHGTLDDPEVKTVVHLHGARVESESDGHPEAWFTRNFGITGPNFKRKVYEYTNNQPGTTLWYHDHAMGITRLNVYSGLAGFYILRDLLEKRLNLPKGEYEIPLLVQDKSFQKDGQLFYPDGPPFEVDIKPSISPVFFGDTIVVNGKVWPYLDVEPRKYRFRILNASNRREYIMTLSNGGEFVQIGSDGGLLKGPVTLKSFKIMPAERIDVIIDFSKYQGKQIILKNSAKDSPTAGTDMIMKFNVVKPLLGEDASVIPSTIRVGHEPSIAVAEKERNVFFNSLTDHFNRPMLTINGMMWSDPVTEEPRLDTVEIWNLINPMIFSHPIHIHLVQFKVLGRRAFNVKVYEDTGKISFIGEEEPPHEYETGFKDTVDSEAGKVTRIIMQFKGFRGDYVWHCHFLEHEDHDMMRPMRVL